jgi:hypothetical protein
MFNSAALSVHRAISSASVLGSMRETITAAPTINVHTTVGTVKMISTAVHGMLVYLYQLHLLRKA